MSTTQPASMDEEIEIPIAPDVETWLAMSPEAREAFLAEALAALQREAELRAEEEARRADEEARRADELARQLEAEARTRAELERQLAELRARLGGS